MNTQKTNSPLESTINKVSLFVIINYSWKVFHFTLKSLGNAMFIFHSSVKAIKQ